MEDDEQSAQPGSSMVLEIPKSIHTCVVALAPHIKVMREQMVNKNHDLSVNYELEARFGTTDEKGNFVSDIGQDTFNNIERMLSSYDQWESDISREWQESHDYFYEHQGQRIRTTVHFGKEGIKQTHLLKSSLVKLTMGFDAEESSGEVVAREDPHPVATHIRASVSQEQEIHPKLVPDIVNPEFVRIKQRKAYKHGCWAFDMTRVWQGATRQEAEARQATSEPCYEFEVECYDPRTYFQKEYHTDEYIATSLFIKMKDFLPFSHKTKNMKVVSTSSIKG